MSDNDITPGATPRAVIGGRYRVRASLGRGGMAVVWRATDELLGREVAVKTLDLTGPDSDTAGERFRREARATAALNHPNIVTVFDTGVEGETAYLVMELLPGPTLAERLRDQGPLPVEEVREIGRQLCAALGAAHAAGIVHRDIKPGNIAYAADGQVKVLDFGITQIMDEALGPHAPLTMTNTVIGTADYLAPEQAAGTRVDARADLYALGCVLFALLAGRPPFTADSPLGVLMKHTQEQAPDLRSLRPEVPARLAGLVAQLLAKLPADRPTNAAVVAERLANLDDPERTEVLGAAATQLLPTSGDTVVMPAAATGVGPAGTEVYAAASPGPTPPPLPLRDIPRVRGGRRVGGWVWLVALPLVALLAWWLISLSGGFEGTSEPGGSGTPIPMTTAPTTSTQTTVSPSTFAPSTVAPSTVTPMTVPSTPSSPVTRTEAPSPGRSVPESPDVESRGPGTDRRQSKPVPLNDPHR